MQAQPKASAPKEKIDHYWFVLLKPGPHRDQDSATVASIQKGHLDNITRLHREGFIKVAGPFDKNELQWRGLFIFDCAEKAEVEKHLQTDPAISSGRLVYDIVGWYTEPSGSFTHGLPSPK